VLANLQMVPEANPSRLFRFLAGEVASQLDLSALMPAAAEASSGPKFERFLNDEPILARPVTQCERIGRWCRRRPAIAGLSAALVLAMLAGFAGTLWQLQQARRNAAENLRQVARLHVLNGVNLLQEGDHFRSLLWFAAVLAIALRAPVLWSHPRFWGEEGTIYFADAFNRAWFHSLFAPHVGYYSLFANGTALAAARLAPLEYAPLVTLAAPHQGRTLRAMPTPPLTRSLAA
jgi:hypothetical protein